jgi:hypothetical protein
MAFWNWPNWVSLGRSHLRPPDGEEFEFDMESPTTQPSISRRLFRAVAFGQSIEAMNVSVDPARGTDHGAIRGRTMGETTGELARRFGKKSGERVDSRVRKAYFGLSLQDFYQ